jgi:hypothetical protein
MVTGPLPRIYVRHHTRFRTPLVKWTRRRAEGQFPISVMIVQMGGVSPKLVRTPFLAYFRFAATPPGCDRNFQLTGLTSNMPFFSKEDTLVSNTSGVGATGGPV